MKTLERDVYEGQSFFENDEDYQLDQISGRVMSGSGDSLWGWYSINKIPDDVEVRDYVDPTTFETRQERCQRYVFRMRVGQNIWRVEDVWLPVKSPATPKTIEAFERAMKVVKD